jgi:glycosyltransferase involved in cell wall biosynthesis
MCILTFTDYYLPGYKGGGPTRTLANFVEQFGEEFKLKIITSDRDLGDEAPYQGVIVNVWTRVGKADVRYVSRDRFSFLGLRQLMLDTTFDAIYLNSFFSWRCTIIPLLLRRLGMIRSTPVILAPRGEFSSGALALKAFKKQLFIKLSMTVGLYGGIIWQASSEVEAKDISRCIGEKLTIFVAPDIAPVVATSALPRRAKVKFPGQLAVIFLSRISRKKNLDGALRMLGSLRGDIQFNIYGPLEDSGYWTECERIIADLPSNVAAQYRGTVAHENVVSVIGAHDLFLFPTHGENFGHVILEAFLAGCPVVLSDQTPWRGLADKRVGWDIPLDSVADFHSVLERCVMMDEEEYKMWSDSARAFGLGQTQDGSVAARNRALFEHALADVKAA